MIRRNLFLLLVAASLGGCAALDELSLDPRTTAADRQLVFAGQLAAAEPGELEAIGQRLQAGGEPTATPIDSLRYALWQARPGHDGHAPEAARERLNELLDGHPPPAIGALIRLELRHLDLLAERAQLAARNQQLSAANREHEAEIEALQEQIQALTTLERRMGTDEDDEDARDP